MVSDDPFALLRPQVDCSMLQDLHQRVVLNQRDRQLHEVAEHERVN
jgi:hypothetical protein